MSVESDRKRLRELKDAKKDVSGQTARQTIDDAIRRVENRLAKSASNIARRRRRKGRSGGGGSIKVIP